MWYIILGVIFIISGVALHHGAGTILFVLLGIVNIGFGIYRAVNGGEPADGETKKKEEPCKVTDEKLIVYTKSHETTGILTELEIESDFTIDFRTDFGRFYKVNLPDGRSGFILKTSKFKKV